MNRLPAATLGPGDVVVVEAYLTRWKTDNADNAPRKRRGWDEWKTGFELLNVSLLKSAPDAGNQDVEDADEGDFWL